MNICIDISPAVHGRAGLGRLANELTAALLALETKHNFSAFYNAAASARLVAPFDEMAQIPWQTGDKPWRMGVLLAHLLRRSQEQLFAGAERPVSLFHATDHLLPYLPHTATVFTLGDLTFLTHGQTHARLNRTFLRLMMPLFLRRANGIITISTSTQRDMEAQYGPLSTPSKVIYPGVHSRFHPATDGRWLAQVRARYGLPQRFVLYVGTIEPRKNLPFLIRAFQQAALEGAKLVISGKKGWMYEETFAQVQALGLAERVLFTGFVADDDLPALLSLAELFVFPSLYEGFGFPVIEAMACGTPVITSDTSSLPEVAGEAALLIDPTDVAGLAGAMARVMGDAGLRGAMAKKGMAQAAKFSWARAAQETVEFYTEIGRSTEHLL
ncbi:MAG: glycosyltransferase family 4 protein [Caldilineaceae bacterium]|nr:glycosyltransferase family 4 protein [Caldilineaceae bacterium]